MNNSVDISLLIEYADRARVKINSTIQYQLNISDHNLIKVSGIPVYYAVSKHFDLILSESWRTVTEKKELDFDKMLSSVWNSEELEKNDLSFKKNLNLNFSEFQSLVKKQFFYFTNNEEFFLFPLFRLKKNGDVIGGLFHFLIKHFEEFNQIHKSSNESTEFWPNELLYNLIDSSINGVEVETKETNISGDYKSTREKECSYFSRLINDYELKMYRVGLYYDSSADLFFINTFHRV